MVAKSLAIISSFIMLIFGIITVFISNDFTVVVISIATLLINLIVMTLMVVFMRTV